MNTISKWTMAMALVSGMAYGQVPSTNDTSDANFNTGMGTGSLGGPNPINLTGISNTASGYLALGSNTTGANNTAAGSNSLQFNTTGYENTATGGGALQMNTTGYENSAYGSGALEFNTTGYLNTASGWRALYINTTGSNNTASGNTALQFNTIGSANTAVGDGALGSNTIGNYNAAVGASALFENTSGIANTAVGSEALAFNTGGGYNTATGFQALNGDPNTSVTGTSNTGMGANALYSYSTGSNNSAIGYGALYSNTTGSNNIAMGFEAGYHLTVGSNNIEIGNQGSITDHNTIKIGTEGVQAKTFIAGIYNTSVTGSAVMIDSSGQLGVVVSSERFKTAIAPMGANTVKLEHLRPVVFKLKTDAKGTLQYGLIAEEVAKVYPELVIRDEKGRVDGVRYDELAPMLLNEVQQQAAEIRDLKKIVVVMQADLLKMQTKAQLVAQR
jgi:hypothetical protein